MARTLRTTIRKAIRAIRPAQEPELVFVEDTAIPPGRDQAIPRQVFQRARDPLVHPTHFAAMERVRATNDDLGWFLYDNEEADEYMSGSWSNHPIFEVYSRATYGQMKADIFRYCIVFEKGGYYLDSNKGLEGKFTELHPAQSSGLITYESNMSLEFPDASLATKLINPFNLVVQWSFGFAPGHEILKKAIDRIVETAPFFAGHVFPRPKNAILTLTGPGMFTHVVREYVAERGASDLTQAGVDFNGKGIFRLKGSKLRDQQSGQDYAQEGNAAILNAYESNKGA